MLGWIDLHRVFTLCASFYSAFDAVPGLSKGLLASYATQHPAQAGVITDGSSALDPLEEPAIAIVYAIGIVCWLLAAGGVAFALRGHAPTVGIVLLGAGAVVFAIDHAAPFGPVGMALFLAGAIVAELGRRAEIGDAGDGRDSVPVLGGTRTS